MIYPTPLSALRIARPMPRVPPATTATLAIFFLPSNHNRLRRAGEAQRNAHVRAAPGWRVALRCTRPTVSVHASVARDAHRNPHAAADAQRRQALFGVALLHFVEQRHQNARAGRADRMSERNSAAIDVD